MTNLKTVNMGQNKFCGPAVLSILTGKNTDECALVISRINGQYNVTGVTLIDLLKALDKLGFDQMMIDPSGSLYRTLVTNISNDGMYMVMVTRHYVCIEIKDKKIYFCDNHTKEPIPAASSARLGMPVLAIYKVIEREKLPEPPTPKLVSTKIKVFKYEREDKSFTVTLERESMYDIIDNKIEVLATFHINDSREYNDFVNQIYRSLNHECGNSLG